MRNSLKIHSILAEPETEAVPEQSFVSSELLCGMHKFDLRRSILGALRIIIFADILRISLPRLPLHALISKVKVGRMNNRLYCPTYYLPATKKSTLADQLHTNRLHQALGLQQFFSNK